VIGVEDDRLDAQTCSRKVRCVGERHRAIVMPGDVGRRYAGHGGERTDFANALFGRGVGLPGPSVASTVSWDLRLHDVTGRGTTVNAAVPFRMNYKTTNAHLDWSMTSGERSFRSDPGGQTTVVAFIGNERNGTFFNSSERDDDATED